MLLRMDTLCSRWARGSRQRRDQAARSLQPAARWPHHAHVSDALCLVLELHAAVRVVKRAEAPEVLVVHV